MSESYRQLIDEVEQVVLYLIDTGRMPENQRIQWEAVKERAKSLPMEDVWTIYSNFASQFTAIDFYKMSNDINKIYDEIRAYYERENELSPEQHKQLEAIQTKYDVENANPDKELKDLKEFFNYVELNKKTEETKEKEKEVERQKVSAGVSAEVSAEVEPKIKNYFTVFNYLRQAGKMNNKAYGLLNDIVTRHKDLNTLYSQECLQELEEFYYSYDYPSIESILTKVKAQFTPHNFKKK